MNPSITFADLMDTPTGREAAESPRNALTRHINYLSYSMADLLHGCPRKYIIKKIQCHTRQAERLSNIKFAFGHAVGAAVAEYDKTLSREKAILAAFLAWDIDLLAEERRSVNSAGRSFWECIYAIDKYIDFHQESDLGEYECLHVEATFAIDLENGYYYSGHIDEVLRHKVTGSLKIKENKTTAFSAIDPAIYANSDQALSYAVAIDTGNQTALDVLYTIYAVTTQEWIGLEFVKQVYKKAEWLQDMLVTGQILESYKELGFYPKRGRNCFSYNTRCEYFDSCDSFDCSKAGEMEVFKSLEEVNSIEPMIYQATLSQVLAAQKERLAP